MELFDKLTILADSAKYDVACTAGGTNDKTNRSGVPGNCICHTFAADGRCVSLLKVLFTNICKFDCKYCVNRRTNDVKKAVFTPEEIAGLTYEFYKRNYIDGLFLSSAVYKNADYTMEQIIKAIEILRNNHKFKGYIHAKTIPGASQELVTKLGFLVDRLSVNIEFPSESSLNQLAPEKTKASIIKPMKLIRNSVIQNKHEIVKYKNSTPFAPAGQSTQMIIGATPETDFQILKLTQALYNKYDMKRVFYSAYIPVAEHALLPPIDIKPPLLREHRLYQADWLLRFYNFKAEEILSEHEQNFNPYLDPKCNWAINNMHIFPVDINKCSYEMLLRVPGIGKKSAGRIWSARKYALLRYEDLKRIGVVLKRAQYFIVCSGYNCPHHGKRETTVRALVDPYAVNFGIQQIQQLSMFETPTAQSSTWGDFSTKNHFKLLSQEAATCISAKM